MAASVPSRTDGCSKPRLAVACMGQSGNPSGMLLTCRAYFGALATMHSGYW